MDYDKFYTKPEIADYCINKIESLYDLNKYDFILEPSAGNGSFSNKLFSKYKKVIALDIEPENGKIIKKDFFEFLPENDKTYFIIGNPPFGRISSLAFKFLQKSCEFGEVVAFILPRTFKRVSIKNKINNNFHLVLEEDLPMKSFFPESMMAKCCLQIWEKRNYKREKEVLKETTEDFELLPIKERNKSNFAIRAYGSNCGEVSHQIESLAPKSWHFIKTENPEQVLKIIKKIDFSVSKDTVRQDSIGAKEFIHLYNLTKDT